MQCDRVGNMFRGSVALFHVQYNNINSIWKNTNKIIRMFYVKVTSNNCR